MIHKIFTVYDSKAEAYMQPFYMQTKGLAIRAIQDTLSNPEHQFAKYTEDYTLVELGEFDDSHATFEIHSKAETIAKMIELKEPK
jgi:hypothetical protein